jgi:hypothetical protein
MLAWQYTTDISGISEERSIPFPRTVDQNRSGILMSLMGRVPFYPHGNASHRQAGVFLGGIDVGPVYTDIEYGREVGGRDIRSWAGFRCRLPDCMKCMLHEL